MLVDPNSRNADRGVTSEVTFDILSTESERGQCSGTVQVPFFDTRRVPHGHYHPRESALGYLKHCISPGDATTISACFTAYFA